LDHWDHQTVIEELQISKKTSIDWMSFCFKVLMAWNGNQEPIRGQGVEVEINETLMARRKYNRGRISRQVWVFGGMERESKRKNYCSPD
jgi:hypothetical protein